MVEFGNTHRRGFLGRVAAGVLAMAAVPELGRAASPGREEQGANPDAWLDRMTGKHRQFFDAPQHQDGLAQIHVFNYLNTYKTVYGAKPGGLTRNIPGFSRFFGAMGYSHGELTNYSYIARECGVDSKTVKEYYQISEDTLLGIRFRRSKNAKAGRSSVRRQSFISSMSGLQAP